MAKWGDRHRYRHNDDHDGDEGVVVSWDIEPCQITCHRCWIIECGQ